MKLYSLILSLSAFLPLSAFADTIVLKDATTIEAYNVEEAGRWVMYTLENSDDAPLQRISIDKVFAIKTADGQLRNVGTADTDTKPASQQQSDSNDPQYVAATPAADNAARIAAYNAPTLSLKKPKGEKDKEKYCSDFLTVWGITSNSILSDENISIDFVRMIPSENGDKTMQYKTKITNKSDKTLYIDLANSFKVKADGSAAPYYTNTVYTEGNSGSKGASLNLGAVAGAIGIGGAVGTLASGVNVGGGSTKTATVTTTEERILTVPPHTSVFLPPKKYSDGNQICEAYDALYYVTTPVTAQRGSMGLLGGVMGNGILIKAVEDEGLDDTSVNKDVLKAPLGWLREFDEGNTIKNIRRIITYSTSPTFDTYTALNFGLYIRAVMGSSLRWNVPTVYDSQKMTCEDESHLLVGIGKVKK